MNVTHAVKCLKGTNCAFFSCEKEKMARNVCDSTPAELLTARNINTNYFFKEYINILNICYQHEFHQYLFKVSCPKFKTNYELMGFFTRG